MTEEASTRLVLVRHGESNATVDELVGGHEGCTGLSAHGRRQVEALRDRLARTGELGRPDAVLASVLPRAVETAEILAPALGGASVVQDCDLCELHPGESDGIPWSEYRERYGVDMRSDPFAPIAPGGESLAEFHLRVGRTLRRLAAEHDGRTVVVACHGGVIAASVLCFFELPLQRPSPVDLLVDNTSLTEWERRPGGRWRLRRYNDAAHLAGV